MASRTKLNDAETLELYRVALENAQTQPKIAETLAELGYDSATISQGKSILAQTRLAFEHNRSEDDETSEAYAVFSKKRTELESIYVLHRKKAKIIFRKDPLIADKLAISGTMPRTQIAKMEVAKKFYNIATTDTVIQSKLARLKITLSELSAAKTLITQVETARSEYLREKGESQNATKAKDIAFAKIDDWMSEFFAVAKIGLKDKPQLMEALGKIVKS